MDTINAKIPARHLFVGQFQHILLLSGLVAGAVFLALPALDGGSWLGITDRMWFFAALSVVIAHQWLVWFVFRFQLVYGLLSRLFGEYDLLIWGIVFMPLLVARALLTLAAGLADNGSLASFLWLQIAVGIVLMIPAGYTMWSVVRYFGIPRALGGDHFRQKYREMPLVTQGMYKYSANSMYTFVFLALWSIALFTHSRAALALALFQHAYIWVHMYCTEMPDMQLIYGQRGV